MDTGFSDSSTGCLSKPTMVCPACSAEVKGRRGKQKLSVMLDHILGGCSVFRTLDETVGHPLAPAESCIEPGKCDMKCFMSVWCFPICISRVSIELDL